ncbi:hypothetical protein [Sphingomonas alpina]|nr:hypothetical protein [Sphingomonas alpina]
MKNRETTARRDLKRTMVLILASAIVMVAGALWYTSLFLPMTIVVVTATAAGVFGSVTLGCGLFALAFYSDKSGHDADSRNATIASHRAD